MERIIGFDVSSFGHSAEPHCKGSIDENVESHGANFQAYERFCNLTLITQNKELQNRIKWNGMERKGAYDSDDGGIELNIIEAGEPDNFLDDEFGMEEEEEPQTIRRRT